MSSTYGRLHKDFSKRSLRVTVSSAYTHGPVGIPGT